MLIRIPISNSFYCKTIRTEKKHQKIKFRLPITLNLFLIPVSVSDFGQQAEFRRITCQMALDKLKSPHSELMSEIEKVLEYSARFPSNEIVGRTSWLNNPNVVLGFYIKDTEASVTVEVGYEQIPENNMSNSEMESMCQLFMEFLGKIIVEYDKFLMEM